MKQTKRLQKLYNMGKTVYSADELKEVWNISGNTFRQTVKRLVDKGLLFRQSKGVYSTKEDCNTYELANTLVTPSYISLNSSLVYFDVAFQVLTAVNSIARYSYKTKIDEMKYRYYKVKDEIFFDSTGIRTRNSITIASPERAICEAYYLDLLVNIDNPEPLNKYSLQETVKIFPGSVQEKVNKLIQDYGL
ncbi:MAG: hypothetical protein ABEJ24_01965 [Candidatus Magasanikbacteria bacterium]